MRHTGTGILMGPGFAQAVQKHAGVAPRWFDLRAAPPEDVFTPHPGELLCLEVTEANLTDALIWIAAVQEKRSARGASPANILVASKSRRLPWRRREWMREQITATGAVFYQVDADQNPRTELNNWLDKTSSRVEKFTEQIY